MTVLCWASSSRWTEVLPGRVSVVLQAYPATPNAGTTWWSRLIPRIPTSSTSAACGCTAQLTGALRSATSVARCTQTSMQLRSTHEIPPFFSWETTGACIGQWIRARAGSASTPILRSRNSTLAFPSPPIPRPISWAARKTMARSNTPERRCGRRCWAVTADSQPSTSRRRPRRTPRRSGFRPMQDLAAGTPGRAGRSRSRQVA